jgi:hypothetical protein
MKNDTPRPIHYKTFVAKCTPQQAQQLISYDHHRIVVNGRDAVMLTYHWTDDMQESLSLKVVFQYAALHPPAPSEVQAVVDQLQFSSTE